MMKSTTSEISQQSTVRIGLWKHASHRVIDSAIAVPPVDTAGADQVTTPNGRGQPRVRAISTTGDKPVTCGNHVATNDHAL